MKKKQSMVNKSTYKVTDLMSVDKYTFFGYTEQVRLYCKLVRNDDEANGLVRKLQLLSHPHDTLYYGVLRIERMPDEKA